VDYATDEERVEDLKRWWKENGTSVIVGVALGLSVLFGWRWWGDYKINQALQASVVYTQLENAIQAKNSEQINAFSDELKTKYADNSYAVYGALSMAKMYVDENKLESARDVLQWGSSHVQSLEQKHLLNLRLARVMLELNEIDKAYNLVNTADSGQFVSVYEELKGDILVKKQDLDGARMAYEKSAKMRPLGSRPGAALQYKIDDLAKSE